jgi:hypothetical protein
MSRLLSMFDTYISRRMLHSLPESNIDFFDYGTSTGRLAEDTLMFHTSTVFLASKFISSKLALQARTLSRYHNGMPDRINKQPSLLVAVEYWPTKT